MNPGKIKRANMMHVYAVYDGMLIVEFWMGDDDMHFMTGPSQALGKMDGKNRLAVIARVICLPRYRDSHAIAFRYCFRQARIRYWSTSVIERLRR
jgi:hypothetical protein